MATFTNTVDGNENAIEGHAAEGRGVVGTSENDYGIRAHSTNSAGLRASSEVSRGAEGWSTNAEGVVGISTQGTGVRGDARGQGDGVFGTSNGGVGVRGTSSLNHGVDGRSEDRHHAGVVGTNLVGGVGVIGTSTGGVNGTGIVGTSTSGVGVNAFSESYEGLHVETKSTRSAALAAYNVQPRAMGAVIFAESKNAEAVHAVTNSARSAALAAYNLDPGAMGAVIFAKSKNAEAVHAETNSSHAAAIAALHLNESSHTAALFAKKAGNGHAGFFDGNVLVTGHLTAKVDIILDNADCAEEFDVSESGPAEPGSVMVIGDKGVLEECSQAGDSRAAGIVSGAGAYAPAIILDRRNEPTGYERRPIALMGKVSCKAEALSSPIGAGDLLMTSSVRGHAMKAVDPPAAGSIIGKALGPLDSGYGLIPVLVVSH